MIEISFFAGQCMVVFGWGLYRYGACRKAGYLDWKREAQLVLFLINLLVIYRITFHPFAKVGGQVQPLLFDWHTMWPFRVNLIPFVNLLNYESTKDMLLNLIGNIAMFIPTGILIPSLSKRCRSLPRTVSIGFLFSLSIEIIQLPFAVRASDVDDLILNTAGVLAGYGIYRMFHLIRKNGGNL